MSVPKNMQSKYDEIAALITPFCDEYLNDEYKALCLHALEKLCRKRPSPLLSGRARTWAGGELLNENGVFEIVVTAFNAPAIIIQLLDFALGKLLAGKICDEKRILSAFQPDSYATNLKGVRQIRFGLASFLTLLAPLYAQKFVNRSAAGKVAHFRKEISRYPHDKAHSHFFQLLNQGDGRKSPVKKPYRLSPLHVLLKQAVL